jgi:hypothetical protein
MNFAGVSLCARYAYPPNSLSLCGPENKKEDLKYYSSKFHNDGGLNEILSKFSTLYPYLKLIAVANNIKDPYDLRVVEAYWIGNKLLNQVSPKLWKILLTEEFQINKKLKKNHTENILGSIFSGGLPHHSFHVLDIYVRTGNIDNPHVIQTMDACIINSGKVIRTGINNITVLTKPLILVNGKLIFGKPVYRDIQGHDKRDLVFMEIKKGDLVSYHWGKLCQKINSIQLRNLNYYTLLSINLANNSPHLYD